MINAVNREEAVTLLRSFTEAHGASGFESEVSAVLSESLSGWGEARRDSHGSTAYTAGAPAPGRAHLMIAAHMDEVGFRVQEITREGFLKFVPLGGWWSHTLLAQKVVVKTEEGQKYEGVIGSKPPHFLSKAERSQVISLENMVIDLGVDGAEAVAALGIKLGDPIVPASTFQELGQKGRYLAKAFDNRVGCAALVQLASLLPADTLKVKLSLAATVQEELGLRGAKTLASALRPDAAIVLEGAPADDTYGFDRHSSQGALGKGVQIRLHDPSAIMSPHMVRVATSTAQKAGIPHQLTVRRSGGTDAGAFTTANEGIPTIVLGVPARYIHTHHSIIEIEDYCAVVQLAAEMVRAFEAEPFPFSLAQ